ncbi:MAG: MarC family protein [Nitrospinota bacterium]|nr:MarC family protein [Nitrospinota bacterium]
MDSEAVFFVNCFVTLISILDPFGAIAILLALTADNDDVRRAMIVGRSIKATFAILTIFALVGGFIFMAFGISFSSLTVAGGLVLCSLAFRMIMGLEIGDKKAALERSGAPQDDVAIIPLAVPLLAGPAAISAVTVFAHRAAGAVEYGLLFAAIASASGLSYIILSNGHRIVKVMGDNGTKIMIRVMGLVLLAMGVEFVLSGVKKYFH